MATEKKYFHDKLILLILSANVSITILGTILMLLKLGNSSASHIIQNRTDLGLNQYKNGTSVSLYAFIVFIWITLLIGATLSYRTYGIRRDFSVIVLGLGLLLIIMAILVSSLLINLP
jgi:hypothetical protein